jgi:hypothetical protein
MMKAHDVRRLRACHGCGDLIDKDGIIIGFADRCPSCALAYAGGLTRFTEMYPVSEWKKLPLGLIGADGMRWLLDRLPKC